MADPTNDSLKPCPFCGGAASLHPRTCDKNTPYNPADRAFPVARCGQCGAEAVGKDWGRPETAAEKWNTRALLAEQARTEPELRSEKFSLLNAAQPHKAEDAPSDAELLDWLDTTNKRFKMGWKVGVAPAGNCSVQSVIFLGNSEPVTIRAAIRAARAAERKA